MRTAAIHITEAKLVELIREYFPKWEQDEMIKLASFLLMRGKTNALSHRMIYVGNDKLLKRVEKVKIINTSDAGHFSQILVMMRRKLKHKGIQQIKPGEADWLLIKEISALATEFCNELGLQPKVGYKIYIEIGLRMIKKYSLGKFKTIHTSIFNRYEAMQELEADRDSGATMELHNVYTRIMNDKTGMVFDNDYRDNPEKYVCFMRAKDDALRLKIPVKIYVEAQFYTMEWQNRIPDPLQLYGDKAIERVRKYCVENNIKITPEKRVNFKKIKHVKNHTG